MRRVEELRELYGFNRWANERLLEAVVTLTEAQLERDLGSSFPSIRDTLVHIMSAEWVWLQRWRGASPDAMPAEWTSLALPGIRDAWGALDQDLQAFLSGLQDSDLDRVISYRNLAGEPFASGLGRMLRHVVNHSTYHRGQVTTMLRQLGAAAPATDLIVYYRSERPER
ncbi:MAG TPA: DinB family protein [Longimicrobiales bacterium]|nr:DinB family protein [Longimicrobiales bacterium]